MNIRNLSKFGKVRVVQKSRVISATNWKNLTIAGSWGLRGGLSSIVFLGGNNSFGFLGGFGSGSRLLEAVVGR